jgi:hypothetical protein
MKFDFIFPIHHQTPMEVEALSIPLVSIARPGVAL